MDITKVSVSKRQPSNKYATGLVVLSSRCMTSTLIFNEVPEKRPGSQTNRWHSVLAGWRRSDMCVNCSKTAGPDPTEHSQCT